MYIVVKYGIIRYMKDIAKSRHSTYFLSYHIVWIPKYRRRFLTEELRQQAEVILRNIVFEKEWNLHTIDVQSSHIHLSVSAAPTIAPAEIVKALKGISARRLLMKYPDLAEKSGRGTLWAPSYFVATSGGVSFDTIQRYIEDCQDH